MKKLLKIYQSFTRAKQIAVGVFLVHCTLLFALSCHHLITSRLKPPRPMVVRTVSAVTAVKEKPVSVPIQPKKSLAAPKSQKIAALKPQKIAALKPQKIAALKPVKKTENPLSEMAKSLETFGSDTKKKASTPLTVPKKVTPLPKEEEVIEDIRYEELLIAFLQESLDLPEFGYVRLKLEIDGFGKLIDCQILEAKSAKNAEFLKNRLPELSFPCLNGFGKIQTFNITFRNVETH